MTPDTQVGAANAAGNPVGAEDLAIAGLVPLSSVDWPDHLVATIFCQGCPWRCPYCQNAGILDTKTPGIVPWPEVRALLNKRQGLLDGVVFTGGEAMRQHALIPAMEEVKARGLSIGLHTAGAYPRRLAEAMDLIDWVGLDIKALPADYREAAGYNGGGKAWEALRMVLEAHRARAGGGRPLDYEVRLTVFPGAPADRHFTEFLRALGEEGVENFALQEARAQGTDEVFQAMAARWDMPAWRRRFDEMSEQARAAGFTDVVIR
ncbi:MAG: anaerobic ribonucleoside-triphosphate reductase activating protein [Ancrocorticia sp.]|uniref:anaerobic ribonucleoside-triphosphate reductase activating protein n=1 Tax=Ancrocorticia sp. TaxID=2593684 RepID=UPI003F90A4B9